MVVWVTNHSPGILPGLSLAPLGQESYYQQSLTCCSDATVPRSIKRAMRLFGWVITREEHAPVPLLTRLEHAEKALEKLTRTVHELGLEWESVLDKIARYTARQAARTKRQIEADTSQEVPSATQATQAEPVPPAVTARMPKAQLRAALASGQLRKLGG